MSDIRSALRDRLWAQVLLGMVSGIGLGLLLSPSGGNVLSEDLAQKLAPWFALPGGLFLAMIQMVVLPLVVSSIIVGIASAGDPAFLRRVGTRVIPYFVITTAIAGIIGASLTFWIRPGDHIQAGLIDTLMTDVPSIATDTQVAAKMHLAKRVVALIPTVQSLLQEDMLAFVILAVFYGIALIAIPREVGKPLLDLMVALQEVAMKVVSWAMKLAPYAVFGLLCDIMIRIGLDAITGMAAYLGTVLLGLALLLVFYLVLVLVFGRMSPAKFMRDTREALLLAFSTSSSAAVIPLSLKILDDTLGVAPPVSKFVVPLGATINMGGTALYQVCAAVFLTQVFGVELGLGALATLIFTTVGASIGSPSAPGVGIVILATILQGIGIPPAGIALIIGVDRILDMSRTAINVAGDLTGCVIMNQWLPVLQKSDGNL